MRLQSYSGTIRILPAIPDDWKNVVFKTLRAEEAFLISAERKAGLVEKIEILPEKVSTCKIENPSFYSSQDL
jgi:alpha-L-fucosidase 2